MLTSSDNFPITWENVSAEVRCGFRISLPWPCKNIQPSDGDVVLTQSLPHNPMKERAWGTTGGHGNGTSRLSSVKSSDIGDSWQHSISLFFFFYLISSTSFTFFWYSVFKILVHFLLSQTWVLSSTHKSDLAQLLTSDIEVNIATIAYSNRKGIFLFSPLLNQHLLICTRSCMPVWRESHHVGMWSVEDRSQTRHWWEPGWMATGLSVCTCHWLVGARRIDFTRYGFFKAAWSLDPSYSSSELMLKNTATVSWQQVSWAALFNCPIHLCWYGKLIMPIVLNAGHFSELALSLSVCVCVF